MAYDDIIGSTSCPTLAEQKYKWKKGGLEIYCAAWRKRILLSHSEWMKGSDALVRALRSSWWEWEDGSAPFYWRWPAWYQPFIRDGIGFPFCRSPPKYMTPQKPIVDEDRKKLVVAKLGKVLDRRYLVKGTVKSLTAFFDVPKGKCDIRMVYDGTVNGFNASIEVPRFGLPTINSHLRAMMTGYFMVDADVGECFLNFHLHSSLQPYVGVDLTHYLPLKHTKYNWVRWNRAGMGLKSSPYQACQAMLVVEELVKGNPSDSNNPFRWDEVVVNIPGSKNYDPSKPWVYKLRWSDRMIACDVFIYVDDLRITGMTRRDAWIACRKVTSVLSYLGVQDAPRKRRDSSRTAGAWAGSVVHTTEDDLVILVTTEKWKKGKSQIKELENMIKEVMVNRKRLQEIRGFLNYIATTYPLIKSYLMGLHLTIDGWRGGRDEDGWRSGGGSFSLGSEGYGIRSELVISDEGPTNVEVKPRLHHDVKALKMLMCSDEPPLRRIRSIKICQVLYGFGDASGSAYGATLSGDEKVFFEYGQWCTTESEQSSNWRELHNLVEALRGWTNSHNLKGAQLFIFTDNSTSESAFWKGTSRSHKLCDLILQMKCIAFWAGMELFVIHVSGRRMKQQGTDGLSRGDQGKGVMQGIPMQVFIPLHLTPTQRNPRLKQWVNELVNGWNFEWLKTFEWFEEYHKPGNFIWDVPPALGDVAYELIDKARMKRPMTMHLILIPRLFTGLWRRLMTRRTDCYIRIDWTSVWDLNTHYEPLILFICIPFQINRQFEERKCFLLEQFERCLQECRVSTSSGIQQRDLLRKFLQQARKIPGL